MNPTHYTFVLTEAQANLLLQAILKAPLPLEQSSPLFNELNQQAQKQQTEKAPPAPAIVP